MTNYYDRVFICKLCGQPSEDATKHFHKGCVIDDLYAAYFEFRKPTKKMLDRARAYGISAVEIRRQALEDVMGIRK